MRYPAPRRHHADARGTSGLDRKEAPVLMETAAYLYAWDVVGDPAAADLYAGLGLHHVTLAAVYHATRALTARHHRRGAGVVRLVRLRPSLRARQGRRGPADRRRAVPVLAVLLRRLRRRLPGRRHPPGRAARAGPGRAGPGVRRREPGYPARG